MSTRCSVRFSLRAVGGDRRVDYTEDIIGDFSHQVWLAKYQDALLVPRFDSGQICERISKAESDKPGIRCLDQAADESP